MAFKLTKNEQARKSDLVIRLHTAADELEDALSLYNTALVDTNSFKDDIVSRLQEEFDDKSDSWKDGDKSESAQALIDTWSNLDFDEIQVEGGTDHYSELEAVETEIE